NRSSTRLSVLGRQLRKGGLHQPPFSFLPLSSAFSFLWNRAGPACAFLTENCPVHQKISGRWGDRPLGRGDGGYSNLKSVWFFWPFCCAREQQDDTQEQTGHYRRITPESQNNFRLLR